MTSSWGRGAAGARRPLWPAAALIAAAAALFYLAAFPSLDHFLRATDGHPGLFSDFWEYDYPMGRSFLAAHEPVDGYAKSAFAALVTVPFGLLPLGPSLWAWGALVLGGIAFLAWLPFLFFRGRPGGAAFSLLALLLILTSFPVLHDFRWGQTGALTLGVVLGAYLLALRGRWVLSSLLLALAVSLKFFPFLFLLPFLMRKDLRTAWGAAAWGALLLFGIPALILGPADTVAFYRAVSLEIREIGFRAQWQGGNTLYLPHVLGRLAGHGGNAPVPFQTAAAAAGYLLFLGNLLLLWLLRRGRDPLWLLWGFCLLAQSIPLMIATSWPCYLSYLPFCQAFWAWEIWRGGKWGWGSASAAALVALSAACSSVFMFLRFPGWASYGQFGLLLWSDLLLLAAAWILLLPKVKASPPTADPA